MLIATFLILGTQIGESQPPAKTKLETEGPTVSSLITRLRSLGEFDLEIPDLSGINDTQDTSSPLGYIAQMVRNMSYPKKERTQRNEQGLWIKHGNEEFKLHNGQIFTIDEEGCLHSIELKSCKMVVRKAVKKLTTLSNSSTYASQIIRTLEKSDNKFIISLTRIEKSYTLFPLPDNRLGFLNNNAYAFQVIEQNQLLVQYAPFNKIGCGAEIRWHPELGMIRLAHELSHAYDANFGLVNDQLMYAYGEVMSAREIRALYHENIIRKELNMQIKREANTGSALIWEGIPFTYPLPISARY